MRIKTYLIAQAGIIAAAYIVLTMLVAPLAFGSIQFRLSEALTALAVLTPAAIPGLFLGCLLANILNPQNLGLIDIVFGSLATLVAATLTWFLGRSVREQENSLVSWQTGLALLPQAVINGLVVGTYLPFLLLPPADQTLTAIGLSVIAVFISEAVVVYLIGVPLLLGLKKTKMTLYRKE